MTYTIQEIIRYTETAELSGQQTYQLVSNVLMNAWRTRVFKMNRLTDEENKMW